MPALVYIHGFLSSPGSIKAQQTKQWLAGHRPDISYHCPYLSPYPLETEKQLTGLMAELEGQTIGLIGSSLGGFWTTWITETYGVRAVLINPSVRPHGLVDRLLGEPQHNFHTNDTYVMTQAHGDQFKKICPPQLKDKSLYWLMAQTGDETLDYRQAESRYEGCKQLIEAGGDHGFKGYENKIPAIVEFLFSEV